MYKFVLGMCGIGILCMFNFIDLHVFHINFHITFQLLMEISKDKNGQVLPLIKPYSGLRLPPDRYCLSAPNYRMTGHRASKKVNCNPYKIILEIKF